ncbi:hypothetical protein ACFQX8_04460 [Klenkia terrae]|uniref:hypothetical protein n=1 Tax=Klenkia terrae TaxID=1052259 RepID=UPI0036184C5B
MTPLDRGPVPRPAVVRLVRFGFEDGEQAARLLSSPQLGLWDLGRNEPADPEAAPVVSALARAGDPDLALFTLSRLVEALDREDPGGELAAHLLARLRGSATLRARLLAVLGASAGLDDHLVAHPEDWTVLDSEDGPVRPTRWRWSRRCCGRSAPTPTTRRGAWGWARRRRTPTSPASATCAGPTCGRCSRWPGGTSGTT